MGKGSNTVKEEVNSVGEIGVVAITVRHMHLLMGIGVMV
jgi:hypothetical protein